MKYLVVSDIHGSLYYAKKLDEIISKENPDKIILLGDLYYHGPRNALTEEYNPSEVAKILNKYAEKILCTKGNCDAEVDEMISDFKFESKILTNISGVDFFFSHGHVYNSDNVPPAGDVIVYGHFHTGFIKEEYGLIFANPGSISLPKNNTAHSYLIINDLEIILKDIEGNVIDEKVYIKMLNNVKISPAKIEDIEAISNLKIKGWQNAYRNIIDDKYLDSMNIEHVIKKNKENFGKQKFIIAKINNTNVGFCGYSCNYENPDEADCELIGIYVTPELKRKGIGKQLIQYVLNDLKHIGKRKMILWCLKENYSSRAFYESMGGMTAKTKLMLVGQKEYEMISYIYEL